MTAENFKVHFRVQQDEDGYPPVSVESMWVSAALPEGNFVVDSIPFFSREATVGDTIEAREAVGGLWFCRIVACAPCSLVRVVFFDRTRLDPVREVLHGLGCATEYFGRFPLLAVSIPLDTSLTQVRSYLDEEEAAERIEYEEVILRH